MDDQLDNDLKNRIREVFDNYEDTTADEGWLLLRERFPEEEKKRPVVWLWWAGVAAGLLLFLSIGVWMLSKKTQPDNTLALKPAKHQQQQKTGAKDSAAQLAATQTAPANTPVDTIASAQNTIAQYHQPVHKSPVDSTVSTPNNIAQNNQPAHKNPVINNTNTATVQPNNIAAGNQQKQVASNNTMVNPPLVISGNNGINNNVAAVQPPANKQTDAIATPAKRVDSVKSVSPKTDAAQYAVNTTVVPGKAADINSKNTDKQVAKTATPTSTIDAMFKAEQNQPKKPAEKVIDDKKVKFGVYAATFFNYAKGSSNQVNAGAGFTSDIKLSKNIKLSTGIALAQNTLKYGSSTPPNTNAASALSYAAAREDNMLAPAASLPTFKNYNASLVGLDVPINIKYEFNPQKTDAYISAGLSSGTFINEAYTTSYGITHNSLLAGVTQQTTDQTDRQSFNSFYFAKTLNVSFGLGTALGKSNRLIIEPFLKYPLQGLGSQQIKFGAGGINLKLNFTNKK
ncbi:hypothetical protein [Mucilaginibacter dorajii]|uniref:Outer membrane protein beta-barrel domain-containing protein n=1 Tax=Mucilaginibacter dorajii TaxID=692994 RepID=A0ABP7PNG0_9SPHI|nr:hypothetical protein [Mucilaginibacter dorajii]MCS3733689.1 hypothetical protein [Mucilaginibacter dorajii]